MRNRPTPTQSHRRGSIAALSVLCLVIVIFFVAMVVDIGLMEISETRLQAAADASALAAASELGDPAAVRAKAKEYAAYHALDGEPIVLEDSHIEIGDWDEATSTFHANADDSGSVVRVVTESMNRNMVFGGFFGVNSYGKRGEAIASTRPRDIIFVVDQSGSMNDDTENVWATNSIEDKFAGTEHSGVGNAIVQDFYTDMGFGTYPGQLEYMGQGLSGVPQNKTAYAKMTENGGALAQNDIPAQYRINDSDSEHTRKQKAYKWMIDNQIAPLMPAAKPAPSSTTSYAYWEKYLDYIMDVEWVSDQPYPTGGGGGGGGGGGPSPGLGFHFLNDIPQMAFMWSTGAPFIGWAGPTHRGWIPPGVDYDRIYRFNNPNKDAYPSGDSSTRWQMRNKIGYRTYSQFLLDWGRDGKPEDQTYCQSSIESSDCPYHDETINGESFQFPPRTQPMNSVRRSLISSLQVIRDRNEQFGMTAQRDLVAVLTFDKPENGTTLVQQLTDDYDAAMQSCTQLQSASDKGSSTTTEVGLRDAYNYLRPVSEGGFGRRGANKVVVLLTDGLPNAHVSSVGDIAAFVGNNPDEPDFYGGGYDWLDAALMQAKVMQAEEWFIYPIGIGFGTDYDFMDRVARIGSTASGGQAMRGTGNPALYEESLEDMFLEIITNAKVNLVK